MCEQRILFLSVSVKPSAEMEKPRTFWCFIIFIHAIFVVCKNNTANRLLSSSVHSVLNMSMHDAHFSYWAVWKFLFCSMGVFRLRLLCISSAKSSSTAFALNVKLRSSHKCGFSFRHHHRSFSFDLNCVSLFLRVFVHIRAHFDFTS